MKLRESETVELKRMVVAGVKKEVAAFANSSGGILYIGVDDDGSVSGVDDADAVIQQITNMVRDSIKPDVTMFVRYEIIDYHGRQIVAVTTQRGTNRPYYLAQRNEAGRCLCASGHFHRTRYGYGDPSDDKGNRRGQL